MQAGGSGTLKGRFVLSMDFYRADAETFLIF